MVYVEKKYRNKNTYYYLVKSIRNNDKTRKIRKYLGKNITIGQLKDFQKKYASFFESQKSTYGTKEYMRKIKTILQKYNITKASLFGSYARGDYTDKSDIDIIIEPHENMGLAFIKLQQELENATNKKIDLVTYESIHPKIKEFILKEERKIW